MKLLKKLGVLMIAAMMMFAVSACFGDVKGVYEAYSFEMIMNGDELASFVVSEMTDEDRASDFASFAEMKIEVTEDELIMFNGDEEQSRSKYRLDGDKIIALDEEGNEKPMEMPGGEASITVKDGKITMSVSETDEDGSMSMTMVFKKA